MEFNTRPTPMQSLILDHCNSFDTFSDPPPQSTNCCLPGPSHYIYMWVCTLYTCITYIYIYLFIVLEPKPIATKMSYAGVPPQSDKNKKHCAYVGASARTSKTYCECRVESLHIRNNLVHNFNYVPVLKAMATFQKTCNRNTLKRHNGPFAHDSERNSFFAAEGLWKNK